MPTNGPPDEGLPDDQRDADRVVPQQRRRYTSYDEGEDGREHDLHQSRERLFVGLGRGPVHGDSMAGHAALLQPAGFVAVARPPRSYQGVLYRWCVTPLVVSGATPEQRGLYRRRTVMAIVVRLISSLMVGVVVVGCGGGSPSGQPSQSLASASTVVLTTGGSAPTSDERHQR
jgi:hypothetical protein